MFLKYFILLMVPLIDSFMPRLHFQNFQNPDPLQAPLQHDPFESRFFGPLKRFLPKIYYYKLEELPTTVPPTTTTKNPSDICEEKNGFLLQETCYLYDNSGETYIAAKAKCETINGKLWTPNLDDPDLYKNLVAVKPANFFGAPDAEVWIGIRGTKNDITGEDVSANHLIQSAIDPTGPDANCGALKWDKGAFYVVYSPCDGINANMKHFVCKL